MTIPLLFWLLFKSVILMLAMLAGSIFAIYGVVIRFVMGLEARPSTIARFSWLCWGAVLFGIALFIVSGSYLARIIVG